VLEGETQETLDSFYRLFQERALPDLGRNIKCGNSLIGPDFYGTAAAAGLGREELLRINPFDWHAEFPEVFPSAPSPLVGEGQGEGAASPSGRGSPRSPSPSGRGEGEGGGFDAVIGNPPYLRVSGIEKHVDEYIRAHYATIFGHFDYYIAFLEKSVVLLNQNGLLGFIIPNKFLARRYANKLRPWLLDNATMLKLVDFSVVPVFQGSSVYPVVLVLTRDHHKTETRRLLEIARITPTTLPRFLSASEIRYSAVDQNTFRANKNCTFDISIVGQEADVFRRIEKNSEPLGTFARALTGTPAIKLFYKWGDLLVPQGDIARGEKALPFINVSNVRRYTISWGKEVRAVKKRLTAPYLRFHPKFVGESKWRVFTISPKIVIARTAKRLTAALDEVGYANLSLYAIVDWEGKRPYNVNYLLGIINSTLLNFWFTKKYGSTRMSGAYITYNGAYLEQIPIRIIDLNDPADKGYHDGIVALVHAMLKLHKDLQVAKTEHEKAAFQRQIAATDRQIDQLVYDLYGLTDAEIRIVEEGTR
jgi:hypothetical protein